jgi:hypothetical protein
VHALSSYAVSTCTVLSPAAFEPWTLALAFAASLLESPPRVPTARNNVRVLRGALVRGVLAPKKMPPPGFDPWSVAWGRKPPNGARGNRVVAAPRTHPLRREDRMVLLVVFVVAAVVVAFFI